MTVPTVENFEKEFVLSLLSWAVLADNGVRRDRPVLCFQADSAAYLK